MSHEKLQWMINPTDKIMIAAMICRDTQILNENDSNCKINQIFKKVP